MIPLVEFFEWFDGLSDATLWGVVLFAIVLLIVVRKLVQMRRQRIEIQIWQAGYSLGVFYGRRQERVETAGDTIPSSEDIRAAQMEGVVRFYNNLHADVPGHGTQPRPRP